MKSPSPSPLVSARYVGKQGVLFQADCLDLLANIQSETVDLVFADPPFNLGKVYEQDFNDKLSEETYRAWCRAWLLESIRVLKPGGALFIYHWPKWLMDLGAWLGGVPGITYRSWIALKMKSGFPIKGRLHPAHYGMLYITKDGGKPTFNVVRTKAPTCRHCKKLQRDYGGYRDKYKRFEDAEGVPWIQISDFWEDTRPATHDKARAQKINELPIHIPERAIQLASNEGDVILDVFSGSASTIHAAQRNERLWIGGDLSASGPALQRIASFWGTKEHTGIPRNVAKCLSASLRDLVRAELGAARPISSMTPEPLDKTAKKYNAKSKAFKEKKATVTPIRLVSLKEVAPVPARIVA